MLKYHGYIKKLLETKLNLRLIFSGVFSFIFYFVWAYWANSAPNILEEITLQTAFVQGSYSGFVTLFFTFILEKIVFKFKGSWISLAFITPILCKFHSKSPQNLAIKQSLNNAFKLSALYFKDKKITGALLAPIIPILIQSIFVILVNVINQTPNLLLTVAPSIIFTALYAYIYMCLLIKDK